MKNKFLKGLVTSFALAVSGLANAGLITNGDFETGDLTGWTVSGLGNGTCPFSPRDWNVSSSSNTGCSVVNNPINGSFAAYNMFDGPSAMEYRLSQLINIENNLISASLDWMNTAVWGFNGSPRTFSINLYDVTGVNLLTNLFSENYSGSGNTGGWESYSIDVTNALSLYQGQTVSLAFSTNIPASWTGAAGFGLDSIQLDVETAQVPEPSTLAVFALGLMGLASRRFKKQA